MRDGYYYDYTFEDDMLYFIHMTEKIENEDISYLMKRAAEKLSTLKLDDRIWSVNFSIDNLPREKNGDLYAACAMVIHFYDRNDDYEIDSQRFYFNLSSGQWESIKNVKNKSISCKNSLACKIGDNYFMIQKSEDGYDYTLYTSDYSEIECLIYKGEFEVSDNIIYIPDIYLNKLNLGVVATGENLNDILKNCYTGNDFLKECNGYKNIAKALFDFVDWQHPNIQDLTDCYDEEEFYNEFGIHFDDLGND